MAVGIGIGIADFPFAGADAFWRWVAVCEEEGIDSIWQTDRLVSGTPFLECMSAMALIAGATRRIKFGMNTVSAGVRDPLLLAKQCATIDYLSGGRLLPAFGIGSDRAPVWQATNLPTARRGVRTNEALEIIRRLWTGEKVTFEGEFYSYNEAQISPAPANPRIPLWIGGSSEAAIRRTARFGTGWLAGTESPAQVAPVIAAIRKAAAAAGRRIPDDHYGAGFPFRFGRPEEPVVQAMAEAQQRRTGRDPRRSMAVGDSEVILARVREYVDAGVSKFVLRPIGTDDADILDQTRRLAREIVPAALALAPPTPETATGS